MVTRFDVAPTDRPCIRLFTEVWWGTPSPYQRVYAIATGRTLAEVLASASESVCVYPPRLSDDAAVWSLALNVVLLGVVGVLLALLTAGG